MQKKNEEHTRLIPTDNEWFNYKKNKCGSWLYCYMSAFGSYNPDINKTYMSKDEFCKNLTWVKCLIGISDTRTIKKYIG